jgi:tetratricopeptide (TPR) repeat protein
MASEQAFSHRAKLLRIREIEKSEGLAAAERALVGLIRTEAGNSHEAFLALGRMLMKGQRLDDALRAAQKARALAPMEVDPQVLCGVIHLRQKDNAAAAECFAGALELDRANTRAMLGAAAVKMATEDFTGALELCERVLEKDPGIDRAHELAARVQMKQGKADEAIAELKALVAQSPDNRRAIKAYLGLLRREGRAEEALSFLEDVAEANPEDRRSQRRLTVANARAGRVDAATAPWREKVEDGSARTSDKVRYAMTLIEAGEVARAREVIADFGGQRGLKAVVAKLEGDIAFREEGYEAALDYYRAACREARVEALPEGRAGEARDARGLARAWKQHATRQIMAAVRARRAAKAEA